MTISRVSIAAFALALTAAQAQTGDAGDQATAPPRSLYQPPPSGDEQPPDVSTDDLQSDEPEPAQPAAKPSRQTPSPDGHSSERPPDVSTDDLQSDEPAPTTPPVLDGSAHDVPSDASSRTEHVDTMPLEPASKPSVEVGTLGSIDGSATGLLDSGNGGFESDMWAGSSRAQIEKLLSRVALASSDGAVRSLARRLVLTKAETPPGTGGRSLIAIRIEKLLDAGMVDDAGALAAGAQIKDDADFARVQANAILLAGRAGDACSDKTVARQTEGDLFWLELRAYCAAASGDTATADLTRSVIDAQGLTDGAYNILVEDVLTGARKPPGPIAKPTAIHLFLLRKAGLPIPDKLATSLGTSALLSILRDPHAAPEQRLAIAERLIRTGAVGTAELRSIADAQTIAADRVANAAANAPKLSFLAAQALLRRAAQLESRPPVKAALVHQALTLGDKAGLFEIASNLQADVAASLDAATAAQNQTPLIGWSLLLAGKTDAAPRWLGDNDAARAVLDLVGGRDAGSQAALDAVAVHMSADSTHPDLAHAIEALVLGLSDALGRPMSPAAKTAAMAVAAGQWPGRRPDAAALQQMVQAAAVPDRKGEAVLRILDIVGAKGPGDLAPDVTIEAVRALHEMGLKDAARALAIHALLLYRPAAP